MIKGDKVKVLEIHRNMEKGYTDLRICHSRYGKVDFAGFVRLFNENHEKAKSLIVDDYIMIGDMDITTWYQKSKETGRLTNRFNLVIKDFVPCDGTTQREIEDDAIIPNTAELPF